MSLVYSLHNEYSHTFLNTKLKVYFFLTIDIKKAIFLTYNERNTSTTRLARCFRVY